MKSQLNSLFLNVAATLMLAVALPVPLPAQSYSRTTVTVREGGADDQRVMLFNDLHIQADERIDGQAVVLFGNLTVDGEVGNQAVVVMGDATINGIVHGQVVAVLGDITLGPKARVDGQVVCTGGRIHRDPGAYVGGQIVQNSLGSHLHPSGPGIQAWGYDCVRWVRPLAFAPHLTWLWIWTAIMLGVYVLLALVFPGGVRRCGDTLVLRPGLTILSAVLTVIAIPVLFILLLVSVVGIPVAFLLPVAILVAAAFGKASLFALIGRRISRDNLPLALSVLIGGAICILLYTVPFLGDLVLTVLSTLGLGCVVTALFTARAERPASPLAASVPAPMPMPTEIPPVMPAAAMPAPAAESPVVAESVSPLPIIPPPPPIPPVIVLPVPGVGLRRAGFWIRTAALLIDVILIGLLVHLLPHYEPIPRHFEGVRFTMAHSMFVLLPAYAVVLWKLKGSTIGGIVFRLKVVRLDGRPVDWATAVVRGLGSYLSFMCVGLGFLWVVFDPERQSWHDKIAGTTVVRAPHGISLI